MQSFALSEVMQTAQTKATPAMSSFSKTFPLAFFNTIQKITYTKPCTEELVGKFLSVNPNITEELVRKSTLEDHRKDEAYNELARQDLTMAEFRAITNKLLDAQLKTY
jgi:hypothetical protein